jgi:hypothetical protein
MVKIGIKTGWKLVKIVGKLRTGIKRRIYIICKKGSEKKL